MINEVQDLEDGRRPEPRGRDVLALESARVKLAPMVSRASRSALTADLATFSVADALQWAAGREAPARLIFSAPGEVITVLVGNGSICGVRSATKRHSFGQHLFAEGLLGESVLDAVGRYSRKSGLSTRQCLRSLDLLDARQLDWAYSVHVLNLSTFVVGWREGRLRHEEGCGDDRGYYLEKPYAVETVMLEAARREQLIEDLGGDLVAAIVRREPEDAAPAQVSNSGQRTTGRARRLLETLGEQATVEQHYARLGGSRYQYVTAIHQLSAQGRISIESADLPASGALRQAI